MKTISNVNIPESIAHIRIYKNNKHVLSIDISSIDKLLKRLIINSENNVYFKYRLVHDSSIHFYVLVYDMKTHHLLHNYIIINNICKISNNSVINISIEHNNEDMMLNIKN